MSERSYPADESVGLLMNQTPAIAGGIDPRCRSHPRRLLPPLLRREEPPGRWRWGDAEDAMVSTTGDVTPQASHTDDGARRPPRARNEGGLHADIRHVQRSDGLPGGRPDSAGTILSGVAERSVIVGMLFVGAAGRLLLYRPLPDHMAGSSCPSQRCLWLRGYILQELLTMHDHPLTAHRFSSSCGTSQPSARCSFSDRVRSAPSRRSKCSRGTSS